MKIVRDGEDTLTLANLGDGDESFLLLCLEIARDKFNANIETASELVGVSAEAASRLQRQFGDQAARAQDIINRINA